ncbi:hypothetical protein PHBOTO_001701 [Pseudozyma hubeiensis]|nr:hypothetical protein PHBOTO_001701 [Pseudozyma hubeiensis]
MVAVGRCHGCHQRSEQHLQPSCQCKGVFRPRRSNHYFVRTLVWRLEHHVSHHSHLCRLQHS